MLSLACCPRSLPFLSFAVSLCCATHLTPKRTSRNQQTTNQTNSTKMGHNMRLTRMLYCVLLCVGCVCVVIRCCLSFAPPNDAHRHRHVPRDKQKERKRRKKERNNHSTEKETRRHTHTRSIHTTNQTPCVFLLALDAFLCVWRWFPVVVVVASSADVECR